MQAKPVFVGVDVAKATLVVCLDGTAARVTVANEEQPIKRWLETLPSQAVVGMESTGCYHLRLAQAVHRSGRVAYVLNAADVYYYAKGLGARSKTDRVDARVIARYVTEHHRQLHAWRPGSQAQAALRTLLQRRANLVRHQVAVRQLMCAVPGLDESARDLEREFERALAQIDRQVRAYLAQDAELQGRCDLLRTIVGIGPQMSVLLAALFSRIPFANADALVAYSGLDPRAHDSGPRNGRRRLSKRGNAELRRMLFLGGLGASHSKVFGPLYRSLKARGFKPTEALVILGRKLLRIAWGIWNRGQPFDPSRIARPT
ncbi:MAG TPA: IS110 family transposase, partial [Xanthobacteraceae bacterium]|nr:IS110 family transposase [Xanthobacteraceae bacterium]